MLKTRLCTDAYRRKLGCPGVCELGAGVPLGCACDALSNTALMISTSLCETCASVMNVSIGSEKFKEKMPLSSSGGIEEWRYRGIEVVVVFAIKLHVLRSKMRLLCSVGTCPGFRTDKKGTVTRRSYTVPHTLAVAWDG